MRTSESVLKIAPALLTAQRKMGAATKDVANPYFKAKYADLGSVMQVVKDPLNEVGIVVLQPTYSKDGFHYVETMLLHESGEFISSDPLKLELDKSNMQQLGSAITYARRYTLQSLLSIPTEDDDGNLASGKVVEYKHATTTQTISVPTEAPKPRSTFRKSTPPVVSTTPSSTGLF